ncbi:MAG: hypothetical protein FP826_15065 [Sphingomonadales bacterium]|nr:hypothetical protein [Sphingomonadales bacterium]MBU3993032.1 hypothetical protein [Alphaproteobacteria bacterium]
MLEGVRIAIANGLQLICVKKVRDRAINCPERKQASASHAMNVWPLPVEAGQWLKCARVGGTGLAR